VHRDAGEEHGRRAGGGQEAVETVEGGGEELHLLHGAGADGEAGGVAGGDRFDPRPGKPFAVRKEHPLRVQLEFALRATQVERDGRQDIAGTARAQQGLRFAGAEDQAARGTSFTMQNVHKDNEIGVLFAAEPEGAFPAPAPHCR
jgi:hypothetical protein